MAGLATFGSWARAGRPAEVAQPISDLAATLRKHGYTVYIQGDDAHMRAEPPEDHCPFSSTGWPVPNPYPWIHALDIMPPAAGSGLPSLADLAARIRVDRQAGKPGVAWLKYINSTDPAGACWHDAWMPEYQRRASTDKGHIHISARSDCTHSAMAAGYDPVFALTAPEHPTESAAAWPAYAGRLLSFRPGTPMLSGADVRTWQARMRTIGYLIAVDGWYGPASASVARAFQSAHGLAVDGVVGPLTWEAAGHG
jgi:hypothetical protein